MMNIETCISFCEILIGVTGKRRSFEEAFFEAVKNSRFENVNRIYFGSNFCPQYFFYSCDYFLQKGMDFFRTNDMRATLCIPVFAEKFIKKGKLLIDKMITAFPDLIDEITVNDIGMLHYISVRYKYIKLNLGRLFNKDARDIRYPDYTEIAQIPALLTLDSSQWEKYKINSIEFDGVNKTLFMDKSKTIPSLYFPYCYATTGQICEFASIRLNVEKKFRPNLDCHAECMVTKMKFRTSRGIEYFKLGRTVYFKSECEIQGADQYRKIYEPLELLED